MSCNCIANFEKEIVVKQPFKDLKIITARFDQALIYNEGGQLSNKPILEIELTCDGRKKAVRKAVIYSHCPFCGKEYEAKAKTTEGEPKS